MKTESIQHVSVLGLGTMGHAIAQCFAAGGCQVQCYDESPAARNSLIERVRSNLEQMLQAGIYEKRALGKIENRILLCESEAEALEGTQFVTEAVIEDLDVKQELFSRIEAHVADECILASNTSSFPMTEISEQMRLPQRAVVTHWFNPPHIVPLIEVVPGEHTTAETAQAAVELTGRIGKLPILLKRELPGFLVNRIQVAILREVCDLLDQGVASPEDIDQAIRGSIGVRFAAMGPLEVSDFSGHDIGASVFQNLVPHLCVDKKLPRTIQGLVEAGHFGVKSGRGFYKYTPDSAAARRSERDRQFLEIVKMFYSS